MPLEISDTDIKTTKISKVPGIFATTTGVKEPNESTFDTVHVVSEISPGAVAIRGNSSGAVQGAFAAPHHSFNSSYSSSLNNSTIERNEAGVDLEGNYPSEQLTQATIVNASVVEDETRRLRQAEDHGRKSVLKNAVVAEAFPMHDQAKYWKYVSGLGLLALTVAVAIVLGSVLATRPSYPEPAPPSIVTLPTLASVTLAPTDTADAPTQMQPSYNNSYCSNAHPIHVDGLALTDSQVGKSPEALGVFHPCDNADITYGVAGWFGVRGNGRAATIRLCKCVSILYVASGECNVTSEFRPSHCFLSATSPQLEPLENGCYYGSWPTLPDTDYYIVVGTVVDAEVSCEDKSYTLTLSSNDFCKSAYQVQADGGKSLGSTLNATRDKIAACGGRWSKNNNSTEISTTSNGVWYTVAGTGKVLTFSTCGSKALQTQLSVYSGACLDKLKCVAAGTTDYHCKNQTSVSWLSDAGTTYYIMVHGENSGPFVLSGSQSPRNDICEGAVKLSLNKLSSVSYNGSTVDATFSNDAEYLDIIGSCGVNLTESPGVWYELDGKDGLSISVDTCSPTAVFQPNVVVLEGHSCDAGLTCQGIAVYSNLCGPSDASNRVTWKTRKDETYFLFVYGNSKNETGDFVLNIKKTRSP